VKVIRRLNLLRWNMPIEDVAARNLRAVTLLSDSKTLKRIE
jgi:hypothetical protein